jgi:hypothetical protein
MTKLNENVIKSLEAKGFNRWQKNGKDRLYINCTDYGCEFEYYNTGNIRSASFNGERISNADGRRFKATKAYVDVEAGEIHVQTTTGYDGEIREAIAAMLEDATADDEKAEAALNPIHECNAREVEMMVGKAMCAFANAESIKRDAKKNIEQYGHEEYRVAVQAGMSEYEATIRIIEMFVKESIYEIQAHVVGKAEAEFGIK